MPQFITNCITRIPTQCLIEDYQALARAVKNQDWDDVKVTMDCIAQLVEENTDVPEAMAFKPSVSSLVALGCADGILSPDGTHDVQCAAGHGVSEAMLGGVLQGHCDGCPRLHNGCDPERMEILLRGSMVYDGGSQGSSELVEHLELMERRKGGAGHDA